VSSQIPDLAAFDAPSQRRPGEIFGHPTCLFTLFFAEMWERFSFYGMKALMILYMVNYLFWRQDDASEVLQWYTGLVYATPIFGGLIADRWIGARWSVVIGGVLIAIGHFLLAFEPLSFFFSGLGFLIIGVGFLKPNISTQVGALYRSNDERRDSAFTVFYMGINTGAFLGPLVCDYLRLHYGWHYGFAAAGVGMVVGLVVYLLGMSSVVRREKLIRAEEEAAQAGGGDAAKPKETGEPAVPERLPSHVYRDRSIVLVVICVFAILFWVGFEQAANVMNLWADQHTNLFVFRGESPQLTVDPQGGAAPDFAVQGGGLKGWRMGAAMTQSINPLFIIIFAGVFAWLWTFLQKRNAQPSTPTKMALGVFFLSCAYGVMLMSASAENKSTSASLAEAPRGLEVDPQGRLYTIDVHNGKTKNRYYGETRLVWENGTLWMNGVLTDIDWMRALGASSTPEFKDAVEQLTKLAEDRADEVREAKKAGQMARDATWEVSVAVPPEAGDPLAVAGWPTKEVDEQEVPKVSWHAETRTLTANDTLSERDKAQVLAAGAEPEFRQALTDEFQQSSVLRVSIGWLFAFYLILTIGELCLSPVGLSLVTKAAPPAYVGLFMGLWFLTTGAVANFLAHFAGGYWETMVPAHYFIIFGVIGVVATVIMLLLIRVLKPMLHGLH
jgi:POT family proton-dependent oligopeptide transporter